ncbi:tyrosine-type recombinase/integrase [Desulfocurvibacter africanus]|uniref:tyrosine-type recombinase/integrase n=1 Tax=Desulfocurvibacter africanus TaxID=873 RepID=UPI00040C4A76|nr:site-specific integrase [Desulfocurvibacter africanus]
MASWVCSKKFKGVRWRLHPTRKHGVQPDRYFTLRFQTGGERREEGLGWASEGWTESKAGLELERLKEAAKRGEGPVRLAEKRNEAEAKRQAERRAGITLESFWTDDYLHALKARVKPCSWVREEDQYRVWFRPTLGNLPLREIQDTDLERVQNHMRAEGRSPRTIQYVLGTFRRIWKHAARRRIVNPLDNPVARLDMPKVENTRLRVLTPSELQAILAEIELRDRHAFDVTMFCAFTGCRASEAFTLKWEHVDLGRETALFVETKNRDAREVFLSPELVDMLQRRGPGAHGGYVFTQASGAPWEKPPHTFVATVKRLGLNKDRSPREKLTFHSLRHTAATFAARRGTPVKDLQCLFGWKTPAMVFRYAKGSEDVQRRAMQGLAQALKAESGKEISINPSKNSLEAVMSRG